MIIYPEKEFINGCELQEEDLLEMAVQLQKDHGSIAATLSLFFATEHAKLGEQNWAIAWSRVADLLMGQTIEPDQHVLH